MTVLMDRIRAGGLVRARTVAAGQSPFSAKTFRSGLSDWRWTFRFDYAPMRRAAAQPLIALLGSLGEGAGETGVWDPDFTRPLSQLTAPGLVNGAGQTGAAIATDGWPANILVAAAGDRVWLDDPATSYFQLFMLIAEARSNGSGQATLNLDYPVRYSPADNSPVYLTAGIHGNALRARVTSWQAAADEAGFWRIRAEGEELV